MALRGIPLLNYGGDIVLTKENILESLREHPLVSEACYGDGEFHVIPKEGTGEKPFSFKIHFAKEKEEGNA